MPVITGAQLYGFDTIPNTMSAQPMAKGNPNPALGGDNTQMRANKEGIGFQRGEGIVPAEDTFNEAGFTEAIDTPNSTNIARLAYNMESNQMLTEFLDGSRAVYYGVPYTVYADLEFTYRSTNHVGARFWDLVNIRGMKGATRYRFEYV